GETQRKKRFRALILAPTHELAVQINQNVQTLIKGCPLKSLAVYGGVDDAPQKQALIQGIDILIATPGRLMDLYTQRALHFDEVETLVLDEADRMLDMGFIDKINLIIEKLPADVQNLLFSATLSKPVRELARSAIVDAVEISIAKTDASKANISQWVIPVDKDRKSSLLADVITQKQWSQALIFIRTKHGAAKLVEQLGKRGIEADAIHSGRNQGARQQVLAEFKKGKVKYLIATGVAARGIDIEELPVVINYDVPDDADDYVHRIGRTGRAQAKGEAVTLVSKDDFKRLCAVERRLGHEIDRVDWPEFSPKKPLPASNIHYVPVNKRNKSQ
ncbi:MAG: DEAD/DEAH box helicase, partial [Vibrio sp.]